MACASGCSHKIRKPTYIIVMEQQAKEYLLKIPLWTKKKNTLEQIRDFLAELGRPDRKLSVIHVAGTNGKGSVCADLTAILRKAGYRTGTFVSPHLVDIRERFLLDGEPVGPRAFEECFQAVLAAVEKMVAKGYCHPSFFEFTFLMAMALFDQAQVDYVVLEAGLGGRLDATNALKSPLACIITSIGLDHTQYLGDNIPQIAGEKAGIIKAGVPVIYDDNQPLASPVIQAQARKVGAPAYPVGWGDLLAKREGRQGLLAAYRSFAAPYQAMNAALAVKALDVLGLKGVDSQRMEEGLSQVCWPGRMEEAAPGIWLDGAHNPDGILAFCHAVKKQLEAGAGDGRPPAIHILFAAVSDKDYGQMIDLLCRRLPIARVTVVGLNGPRGANAQALANRFFQAGCACVEAYASTEEALAAALGHRKKGDRLYVVGSLYLIGEIKEKLPGPEGCP